MMGRRIEAVLLASVAMVWVIGLAGCGGGSPADDPGTPTASIEGTVYASAVQTSGIDTAQLADPQPVGDCPVDVVRERDRERLRTGRTDDAGGYRFEGLPAGETVLVRARLRSGAQLQSRARLGEGGNQVDVSEDTTMAEACRALTAGGGEPDANQTQTIADVAEACLRYQQQNRFRYGQRDGAPPDFSDQEAVEEAAADLLAAATDGAVREALQTRSREDCEKAVAMVWARLQQHLGEEAPWGEKAMQRLAEALQRRERVSGADVGNALRAALGENPGDAAGDQARARIREIVQAFGDGAEMEVLEATAGACTGEQLRLRTRAQVHAFLNAIGS
ncbi:MAG: hypothetical protein ACP5KN_11190 [Armatimonadota bacterium]